LISIQMINAHRLRSIVLRMKPPTHAMSDRIGVAITPAPRRLVPRAHLLFIPVHQPRPTSGLVTPTTAITLAVELALTYTIHKIRFQAICDPPISLRFAEKEFGPVARERALAVQNSPVPHPLLLHPPLQIHVQCVRLALNVLVDRPVVGVLI
jgi:hypothetical protein